MAYDVKNYSGAALDSTLVSDINSTALSFVVVDATNWPSANFSVVFGKGTATEEKVFCASRVGTSINVAVGGRGYDGTTAQTQTAGTTVGHCLTATDFQEANKAVTETVGRITAKGDLLLGSGANATAKLPISTNGLALQPDSAQASGARWGTLAQSVTHDSPDTDVSASSLHHTLGTTSTKAAAGNHTHNGDGTVQVIPTGMINPFAGTAAPTGWLLCDGSAVSRTTYAALFAVTGTAYGSGDGSTTFNLPNLKGRTPAGVDAGQAEFSIVGQTGGAKTQTIGTGNLPPHTHAIDHDHAAFTSAAGSAHSHNLPIQYATNTTFTGSGTRVSDIQGVTGGGGTAATPATNTESAHTHSIDVPAYTGSSGNGPGSSTPLNVQDPYLTLSFIVKT